MILKEKMDPNLVFIVGRGRSGTSLLCSILNTHPEITVIPEGLFVINLYHKYKSLKNWEKKTLRQFYQDLFLDERLNNWWMLNKADLKEDLEGFEGENSFSTLCRFIYLKEAYAQKKQEPRIIIDKNNTNSLFIQPLMDIFPAAKFIHIVRDPRDTITSYQQVPFDSNGPVTLAQRWKFYNREILKLSEKYPEKFFLILFENLLEKPQHYLVKLCSFLGISYSPDLLRFYEKNQYFENIKGATQEVKTAYQNINKPLDSKAAYKWRQLENPTDLWKINFICQEEIKVFGYEPGELGHSPLSGFKLYPGIWWGNLLNFFERFIFRLPLSWRTGVIYYYRRLTKTI